MLFKYWSFIHSTLEYKTIGWLYRHKSIGCTSITVTRFTPSATNFWVIVTNSNLGSFVIDPWLNFFNRMTLCKFSWIFCFRGSFFYSFLIKGIHWIRYMNKVASGKRQLKTVIAIVIWSEWKWQFKPMSSTFCFTEPNRLSLSLFFPLSASLCTCVCLFKIETVSKTNKRLKKKWVICISLITNHSAYCSEFQSIFLLVSFVSNLLFDTLTITVCIHCKSF